MFDITSLITYTGTATGFATEILPEKQPQFLSLETLPAVFMDTVKVLQLDQFGTGISDRNDFDNQLFAEDLVQVIEIQFVCLSTAVSTVFNSLSSHLAGWQSNPSEVPYSGLRFISGDLMGKGNGRSHWSTKWGIEFPRTFTD